MSKSLDVGGVGYIGHAGTNLPSFAFEAHGAEDGRVFYRVKHGFGGVLREGIFGKDVREGYLTHESLRALEQIGTVKYKTRHDVESAGMGDYILWGPG